MGRRPTIGALVLSIYDQHPVAVVTVCDGSRRATRSVHTHGMFTRITVAEADIGRCGCLFACGSTASGNSPTESARAPLPRRAYSTALGKRGSLAAGARRHVVARARASSSCRAASCL
eukprot:scaffold69309_cov65-Phaeocystis_antarctica.AAC.8